MGVFTLSVNRILEASSIGAKTYRCYQMGLRDIDLGYFTQFFAQKSRGHLFKARGQVCDETGEFTGFLGGGAEALLVQNLSDIGGHGGG